jgi:predicted TIM-barrel fold metal-dependent hydrolase
MRIVDADSHFMEPLDWFRQTAPKLADRIPDFLHMEVLFEVLGGDVFSSLPPSLRPGLLDLAPKGTRERMKHMLEETYGERGNEAAAVMYNAAMQFAPETHDGAARMRWLDAHGIDVQIVLPSAGIYPYKSAIKHGLQDLRFKALEAYNTWSTDQCAGYTERLIPATLFDLSDPDWAVAELERVRKAGSRVVWIKAEPAGGKSLAHPDLDRFWAAAADLGVTALFHVGAGRPAFDHAWANNGGRPLDVVRLHRLAMPTTPQLAVASLVFGGVLERHPSLGVLVAELGIGWVPEFIRLVDSGVTGEIAFDYDLPLKPSEYVERQVRISALRLTDQLQPSIAQVPPGVIVFSTDFGHPEGSAESEKIFGRQLVGVDERTQALFYGESIARLLGV